VRKRPSPALIVSLLALFVALGGPAQAERLIRGKDVKDGSLQERDLSRGARKALKQTPDGSVGTRQLAPSSVLSGTIADEAITAADLAPNSVGADEIADNGVGQAEIRNNGVGASEIADQSIDGGEIIDGGLRARDVARFSGSLEVRLPAVPKQSCLPAPVSNVAAGADISGDLVVVSASEAWPDSLSYHVRGSDPPGSFVFVACNPTIATVTPPAVVQFRYAVLGF